VNIFTDGVLLPRGAVNPADRVDSFDDVLRIDRNTYRPPTYLSAPVRFDRRLRLLDISQYCLGLGRHGVSALAAAGT
jgi:hypothetical protein